MAQAVRLFRAVQVISPLWSNQKVRYRGRSWSVRDYFRAYPGVAQIVIIYCGETDKPVVARRALGEFEEQTYQGTDVGMLELTPRSAT